MRAVFRSIGPRRIGRTVRTLCSRKRCLIFLFQKQNAADADIEEFRLQTDSAVVTGSVKTAEELKKTVFYYKE